MRKYLKAPALSTSFSESGKSAKNRLEQILNTRAKKTGVLVLAVILVLAAAGSAMFAWRQPQQPQVLTWSCVELLCAFDLPPDWAGKVTVQEKDDMVYVYHKAIRDAYGEGTGLLFYIERLSGEDWTQEQVSDPGNREIVLQERGYTYVFGGPTDVQYPMWDGGDKALAAEYERMTAELAQIKNSVRIEDQPQKRSADALVSDALLTENTGSYMGGECVAEGHVVLDTEEQDGKLVVYALTMYGEYGFQNGNFVKISGSGVIPARLTFDEHQKLTELKWPMDGAMYAESIQEMFPEQYWDRALSTTEEDLQSCKEQERAYAAVYLKQLGREAKIGDYADFDYPLADLNVEVSNKLLDVYWDYPYWIGTEERLENGVRYVYEKQVEERENGSVVTFKKYRYDTGEVAEETVIDTADGSIVSSNSTPRLEKAGD